jgi:elongation factor G
VTPVLCGAALRNKGIQPLLDAVCSCLPSPADLPETVGTHPKSGREVSRKHSSDEPLGALAFKVASDRHGDLVFVRVYSGCIEVGQRLYNATKGKRERVAGLWRMHADHRAGAEELRCGEIGVVSGLRFTTTGDSLCNEGAPVLLETMKFPETVVSMAIEPRTNADREKLDDVLKALEKEDPTFEVATDAETGQTIISGMGELHLEVLRTRMVRDFSVDVNVGNPRVAYRETLKGAVTIDEELVRETGGRGQYARVVLEMAPVGGTAVEFEPKADPTEVPREYLGAVAEGVKSSAQSGGLKGYPVVGVKAVLVGGGHHPVDSSEVAFTMASSRAFQRGLEQAGTALLEPVMRIEVSVSDEYLGDVLNDLNGRRAEIEEVMVRGRGRAVRGKVPLAEMFGYATALRSLTQGRAAYTMEPLEYGRAPAEGGR